MVDVGKMLTSDGGLGCDDYSRLPLPDAKRDIVAELRGITDQDARSSAPMILDNVDRRRRGAARAALAAAFDDPAVTELRVFSLGDGAAMAGILVAGRRDNSEATSLVFLLD